MPRKRIESINSNINTSLFLTYWHEYYNKEYKCFNRYREIYQYTV
jgi:hypothetical protein